MNIDPSPMSPDELRAALDVLGWTQADLAERLGVAHSAVSHWFTSRHACKGPAAALIRIIIANNGCELDSSEA